MRDMHAFILRLGQHLMDTVSKVLLASGAAPEDPFSADSGTRSSIGNVKTCNVFSHKAAQSMFPGLFAKLHSGARHGHYVAIRLGTVPYTRAAPPQPKTRLQRQRPVRHAAPGPVPAKGCSNSSRPASAASNAYVAAIHKPASSSSRRPASAAAAASAASLQGRRPVLLLVHRLVVFALSGTYTCALPNNAQVVHSFASCTQHGGCLNCSHLAMGTAKQNASDRVDSMARLHTCHALCSDQQSQMVAAKACHTRKVSKQAKAAAAAARAQQQAVQSNDQAKWAAAFASSSASVATPFSNMSSCASAATPATAPTAAASSSHTPLRRLPTRAICRHVPRYKPSSAVPVVVTRSMAQRQASGSSNTASGAGGSNTPASLRPAAAQRRRRPPAAAK